MIKLSNEDKKEAEIKAFELLALCLASGPCNNCVFFDQDLLEDQPFGPCAIGCPNSWPLFDPSTIIGNNNRKIVLDILHRKEKEAMVSKAAQELDPIVNECPCKVKGYSDTTRMSCCGCPEYYD